MFLFVVHFNATWTGRALATLRRSESLHIFPGCSLSTPCPYLMLPCPKTSRYEEPLCSSQCTNVLCKSNASAASYASYKQLFTKDFDLKCIDNVSEDHAAARPLGPLVRPNGSKQSNDHLKYARSAQKASQELAGCSCNPQDVLGALKSYLH